MPEPINPTQVAQQLAALARDLDVTVSQLEFADRDSTEKRAAADLAFSRAFIAAVGSVDLRKHTALVETHHHRLDADVADALVRHLRRRVDALKVRIDVGRTWSSALKAELSLTGHMGEA